MNEVKKTLVKCSWDMCKNNQEGYCQKGEIELTSVPTSIDEYLNCFDYKGEVEQ